MKEQEGRDFPQISDQLSDLYNQFMDKAVDVEQGNDLKRSAAKCYQDFKKQIHKELTYHIESFPLLPWSCDYPWNFLKQNVLIILR